MAMTLQEKFRKTRGDLLLPGGEYEGPLVINRRCTVDGGGATLWCEKGPVVEVKARDVVIKNLRIEVVGTGASVKERTALSTKAPDTILENVEVCGVLHGFKENENACIVPRVIDLGVFAADTPNSFAVKVTVPEAARMRSNVAGMRVSPENLPAGSGTILLELQPMRDGAVVYGDLMFETEVLRRSYVRGIAQKGAPRREDEQKLKLSAGQPQNGASAESPSAPQPPGARRMNPVPGGQLRTGTPAPQPPGARRANTVPAGQLQTGNPAPQHPGTRRANPSAGQQRPTGPGRGTGLSRASVPSGAKGLVRGQRLSLSQLGDEVQVRLVGAVSKDIDMYIFALQSNDKVGGDDGLVFFGNTRLDAKGTADLDLAAGIPTASFKPGQAAPDISRLLIVFSVYKDAFVPARGAFADAYVEFKAKDGDIFVLPMSAGPDTRTDIAAEFYRYKDAWKLRCIDQAFPTGIEGTCRMYGVDLA